ncbi:hypothetical protein [Methylocystis parvus]|uniref:Uncharacterized protein n=1 Tax=Methylocystis parvus TaxID=134 RepID=A0A6B8LZV3_9HYPH|nr:hypothetical protein [Methylocystis parvus]QGM97987.1 hypothetical protein F7D14_11210 [Methylocystis parvus]WBK01698.1 hypothetical protein MMG94_08360 [Methylocystis parvus OBBP]
MFHFQYFSKRNKGAGHLLRYRLINVESAPMLIKPKTMSRISSFCISHLLSVSASFMGGQGQREIVDLVPFALRSLKRL